MFVSSIIAPSVAPSLTVIPVKTRNGLRTLRLEWTVRFLSNVTYTRAKIVFPTIVDTLTLTITFPGAWCKRGKRCRKGIRDLV